MKKLLGIRYRALLFGTVVGGLLLFKDQMVLAAVVLGWATTFHLLHAIEVKLNLLLDEKGLRPTEDDYER